MFPDWRERLVRSVAPLDKGVRSLEVNGYRPLGRKRYRPNQTAAVLVPVLDQPEPGILLTRRAEHLFHHPGQVSFPGGRAEESDISAVQTALREAEEEIGLESDYVTPVGFLDRFDTVSDYRVLPIVALVRPPARWKLDTREVVEVFTLPLEVALNREMYQEKVVVLDEVRHVIHSLEWQGNRVWGATAAMLLNLVQRMERNP